MDGGETKSRSGTSLTKIETDKQKGRAAAHPKIPFFSFHVSSLSSGSDRSPRGDGGYGNINTLLESCGFAGSGVAKQFACP